METKDIERIAVLGASRGLGAAFFDHVKSVHSQYLWFLSSRKIGSQGFPWDFSKPEGYSQLLGHILEFKPTRLFYFAGGGPYGPYSTKQWKDHLWAWNVSYLCPAYILHGLMSEGQCHQFVVIGSAIAEDQGDPRAPSYAAAKHGLRGLHSSVVLEDPPMDFRLFSPAYMDTDLLPKNAYPRQQGKALLDPMFVAKELWKWCGNGEKGVHRTLTKGNSSGR